MQDLRLTKKAKLITNFVLLYQYGRKESIEPNIVLDELHICLLIQCRTLHVLKEASDFQTSKL